MENTENKNYEGFYTDDGWWICPEDDVYNDLYDELFGDKDMDEALLENTFHEDLTSPLAFVFAYIPWKYGSTLATADAHEKRPALLLLRLVSDDGYYVFQLTTSKSDSFVDSFKFELVNSGRYKLRAKNSKSSYIRCNHIIKLSDQNIIGSTGSTLSHSDCKGLYDMLINKYDKLPYFNNDEELAVYDRLIKMLETYLDIKDSFFDKNKADDFNKENSAVNSTNKADK